MRDIELSREALLKFTAFGADFLFFCDANHFDAWKRIKAGNVSYLYDRRDWRAIPFTGTRRFLVDVHTMECMVGAVEARCAQ